MATTYHRFLDGSRDNLPGPGYDVANTNRPASILCVNTPERARAAARLGVEVSNLSMENGCRGESADAVWMNEKHRCAPDGATQGSCLISRALALRPTNPLCPTQVVS